MNKLIQLTLEVRQLEESVHTCQHLKGILYAEADIELIKRARLNSAVLTTAANKLREARMMLGDILRLVGVEKPYDNAYTGKLENEEPEYMKKGALKLINWEEVVGADKNQEVVDGEKTGMLKEGLTGESICLGFLKTKLGTAKDSKGLFYSLLDMKKDIQATHNQMEGANPSELTVYFQAAASALKLANCNLGLRFGELVSA